MSWLMEVVSKHGVDLSMDSWAGNFSCAGAGGGNFFTGGAVGRSGRRVVARLSKVGFRMACCGPDFGKSGYVGKPGCVGVPAADYGLARR